MAGRTKHQELLCHALSSQLQSQVCQALWVTVSTSAGKLNSSKTAPRPGR